MRRVWKVLGAALLLGVSLSSSAESLEAGAWMDALRSAYKNQTYQGTALWLHDDQSETLEIAHAVRDGVEQRRVRSLDDPNQAGRSTNVDRSAATLSMLSLPCDDHYRRFYQIRLGEQEHLIGRLTQIVNVEPQDDYRYARRYWIDVDSKLPLKLQVLHKQRVMQQLVFSNLSVGASAPFDNDAPLQSASLPLEALQWRLRDVPPGYKLMSFSRHPSRNNQPPVEHLLLSDGLSSLSLYIEAISPGAWVQKQAQHLGPVHIYIRSLQQHRLTVIGEVPMATVSLVGDGVQALEKSE